MVGDSYHHEGATIIRLLQLYEEEGDVTSPLVTPITNTKKGILTSVIKDFLYGSAINIDAREVEIHKFFTLVFNQYYIVNKHN